MFRDLFYVTRLGRPFDWRTVVFVLYVFPWGVITFCYRLIFLLVNELFIAPLVIRMSRRIQELYLRFYVFSFLMFVRVTGWENWDPNASVIVSNHVSEMDGIACRTALGPLAIIVPPYYRNLIFCRAIIKELHPLYLDPKNPRAIRDKIQKHLASQRLVADPKKRLPILCFPEGALTSGKGLLMYYRYMFSLGETVQPIALTVWRPLPIHLDTLCTPIFHNVIWFFLVPFQRWRLHILPAQRIEEGESPEQFAARVQALTAKHLGIFTTNYSKSDKYVLVSKYNPVLRRRYRNKALIKKIGGRILTRIAQRKAKQRREQQQQSH